VLIIVNGTVITFVKNRPLLLWSGSVSSGTITVPYVDTYKTFLLTASSGAVLYNMSTINGINYTASATVLAGSNHITYCANFTRSGNVLTITANTYMVHTASSTHSAMNTGTRIFDTLFGIV
jgi:hypothetical protein